MSSVHCIVVWEYQSEGLWLPHTPGVTRTLERAHAKKLTRVVLADADPTLKGHYVNLRTLTQCQEMPDGSTSECAVCRSCYSVQSVGGRGACWEWALFTSPPLSADLHYEPMPMELQCLVEESVCGGGGAVQWREWCVSAARGAARSPHALRLVRRRPHPPYPLARIHAATHNRPTRIPQQHTGSSVHSLQSNLSTHSNHSAHSVQSNHSAQSAHSIHSAQSAHSIHSAQSAHSIHSAHSTHSVHSAHSAQSAHSAESSSSGGGGSPRDRKPGLARQILHNLNIFSAHSKPSAASAGDDGGSARRHSVDTVSTYLSHESKDSAQRGSVGELLDCSGGSDDVFESAAAPRSRPHTPHTDEDEEDDDEEEDEDEAVPRAVRGWVSVAAHPQWGAVCWRCRRALRRSALMLRRCSHMLHAACLRRLLLATPGPPRIECPVCGEVYSEETDPPAAPPEAPMPPPPPPGSQAPSPAPLTSQPPGSMAWRLQRVALPHTDVETSILVTYNFQSGVQGPRDPVPGARYYAVGFPRHSLLPDDALGREVLALLWRAWSRGALFAVRVSRTTGREHVVSCRAVPPPARAAQYARGAGLLRDARDSLLRLLRE